MSEEEGPVLLVGGPLNGRCVNARHNRVIAFPLTDSKGGWEAHEYHRAEFAIGKEIILVYRHEGVDGDEANEIALGLVASFLRSAIAKNAKDFPLATGYG